MIHPERLKGLQKYIADAGLGALAVTDSSNIFYLLGFNAFDEGDESFILIVKRNEFKLISPLFYQNRIGNEVPKGNVGYSLRGESLAERAAREVPENITLGFERESLSFTRYEVFKKAFRKRKLVPVAEGVEQFRKTKDDDEIALIKKASTITDRVFKTVTKLVKPGVTERYLQKKIGEIMSDFGAQSGSFTPIAASGKNSADPHYSGTDKKIKAGEMIVFDIGARYKNYDADMTRMVFVGKATEKYKKLYQIVLETQENGLKDCQIGASTKQIYENSAANFKKFGQDEYFTHGLGHGVGIDIHEAPSLSAAGTDNLQNGMVFTVEPGLYHAGWGGIRIEDLCVMRNNKLEVLSKTTKKLIEL